MVDAKWPQYSSSDPLDLGEALWVAHWALPRGERWAQTVTARSFNALETLWQHGYFRQPTGYRLAFREFGTTLGAQVSSGAPQEWADRVRALHGFWATKVFDRDADISPVMMAASLVPRLQQIQSLLGRLPPTRLTPVNL